MQRRFFAEPPETVAPLLLGKLLARRTPAGWLAGRIVEVEAYLGPHITDTPDPASHSFRGVTARNSVMFGPPGHAYVYFIYGMYYCLNVSCEPDGQPGGVLFRGVEGASGPGRLCKVFGITRERDNGVDFTSPKSTLQIKDDGFVADDIVITPRIGISKDKDRLARYLLPKSK